jgi:hypothetical protein
MRLTNFTNETYNELMERKDRECNQELQDGTNGETSPQGTLTIETTKPRNQSTRDSNNRNYKTEKPVHKGLYNRNYETRHQSTTSSPEKERNEKTPCAPNAHTAKAGPHAKRHRTLQKAEQNNLETTHKGGKNAPKGVESC